MSGERLVCLVGPGWSATLEDWIQNLNTFFFKSFCISNIILINVNVKCVLLYSAAIDFYRKLKYAEGKVTVFIP